MTISDQIKFLNMKTLQNEAQYDLDRKAAKISALSSNNLDKYEYLAGEDLGLKPSTIEQAKFQHSPLGKIFNKGLDKDDQKEGLFNRLKNIEDKSEDQSKKQLDAIKNNEHKFKTAKYDFSNFTFPSKFASKICNKTLMLQEAEDNQQELEILTQAK